MVNTIPDDDLRRKLTVACADASDAVHVGLAGNTYTILLTGRDTAGRYCLIDMHVAPGGGPAPHRHDFEESFTVLAGEIEAMFRGERVTVRAGETIHIPANAPHRFQNMSNVPARLLCVCSPAGQEEFFTEVGVRVSTRTEPPPPMNAAEQAAFREKARALAQRYRTEMLPPA
jgi:mannose-6-phosphate isomerase-like protein (cupin superfamily)